MNFTKLNVKIFTIGLFALSVTKIAFSQISTSSRDVNQIFTRAEIPPKFSGSLSNYFDSVLASKTFPGKGRVIIEVKIDTAGTPHFMKYIDHTDGDVSNWNLQEIVNQMPIWSPSYQNGRPVNFLRIILLDIADYKLRQVADKDGVDEMKYMLNSNKF